MLVTKIMSNDTSYSINIDSLVPYLKCLDHTVSNEEFELLLDETLDMLITTPQPSIENLGKYYESESYISHTDSKHSFIDRVY